MKNPFKLEIAPNVSPLARQHLAKYHTSRMNLLLIIAFTLVNVGLLIGNGSSYFLFSACIPYVLVSMGMDICGLYPPEYYEEVYQASYSDFDFYSPAVFAAIALVALAFIATYVLAFLLSNNGRVGWLIAALVMVCIDTAAMFYFIDISIDSIIDILFHAWMIYYLVIGVTAHKKLKNMPPELYCIPCETPQEENTYDEGNL